jgi:MYXO-CTERM domain-containing protein
VCAAADCGAPGSSDATSAGDAAADATDAAGASDEGSGEQGCQCRASGDAPLAGVGWMLAGALALLALRGGPHRRRGTAGAQRS